MVRIFNFMQVLFYIYTLEQSAGTRVIAVEKQNFATLYRGADKSLARPGRKKATAREDFGFHISYL
jgi:hypothetical protein